MTKTSFTKFGWNIHLPKDSRISIEDHRNVEFEIPGIHCEGQKPSDAMFAIYLDGGFYVPDAGKILVSPDGQKIEIRLLDDNIPEDEYHITMTRD